ncbi:MAG: hypothetical protein H0V96_08735 [Acidimicrobiia bacterium]|nr:hypothetical protein [Acidimicrobiia bacterium]
MAQSSSRRNALIGLIGGVLVIPALALASSTILGTNTIEAEATAATVAPAAVEVPATTTTAVTATAGDIRRACGRDGATLVAAESDGSITDIQQAALDALRPICKREGRPLAGPPTPEPVVVTASPLVAGAAASFEGDDDHHDDDSRDDDSWDDDSADSWDDSADSWDD